MEYETDPALPWTIRDARLIAHQFDRQKLPLRNFDIWTGFAPLADIRSVNVPQWQEGLTEFENRIVVPAFLLYTDYTPLNISFPELFKKVTNASGLGGSRGHPATDIFFMMIDSPDHTNWVQLPFIIADLNTPDEMLLEEIRTFEHMRRRTDAQTLVMGMKKVVRYAYTGDSSDITQLTEKFYDVYGRK